MAWIKQLVIAVIALIVLIQVWRISGLVRKSQAAAVSPASNVRVPEKKVQPNGGFDCFPVISESQFLRSCWPIEIVVREDERSSGVCGDVGLFVKNTHARLSPVFNSTILLRKLTLCPNSTFVHVTPNIPATLLETPNVRNWWLGSSNFTDYIPPLPSLTRILCKSKSSCKRYAEHVRPNTNSPVDLPITYISHSTPDLLNEITYLHVNNHVDYNRFLFTYTDPTLATAKALASCWSSSPNLQSSRIVLLGPHNKLSFGFQHDEAAPKYLRFKHAPTLSLFDTREAQVRSGVHFCEGGDLQCIVEARSLGALVVAFGEKVGDGVVDGVNGIVLETKGGDVCELLGRVMNLDIEARWFLGREGRRMYEDDTVTMERALRRIRNETMRHLVGVDDAKVWKRKEKDLRDDLEGKKKGWLW
ncbi:hypothetical protein BCR33DRAFT_714896 [Rhizoclosmatium globosum]|uniref:Glycosyl transferase family 1 domain-containing protein n=1 Tax=Rhizoclosmatium globosum TaxID=329046 RepID=A0A1Y2CLE1_9FUNG|nr:hypothetical protein BCR33DRAFT_714896 [Rhizoclosmatium globosum]|eukprot:ORY47842.1 hypothetical protein BCR33DRAFT_714896 [Rhizoclosmatium globosum]